MAGLTVLDASVLIAVFDEEDAHAEDAARIVADADRLAVSSLTLGEAMVAPVAAGNAERYLSLVGRLEIEEIGLPAGSAHALADLRATTGLELPGCCVLYAAQQIGARAVAARDDHLRKRARELGFETP